MMDKLAIIRGIKSNDLGDHTPHYIYTGFPDRGKRPGLGSIVSYLRPSHNGLPVNVASYKSDLNLDVLRHGPSGVCAGRAGAGRSAAQAGTDV